MPSIIADATKAHGGNKQAIHPVALGYLALTFGSPSGALEQAFLLMATA